MIKSKPFKSQFKKGDIICSDEFHSGKCMIVEEECGVSVISKDYRYICQDLILENQGWCAFEFDSCKEYPNNWRLATDEDICKYIDRYLDIRTEMLDVTVQVKYMAEDFIRLGQLDTSIYLDLKQAAKLRDYLNKYVIGG